MLKYICTIFIFILHHNLAFAASSSEPSHIVVLDDLKGKSTDVYRSFLSESGAANKTLITCKDNIDEEYAQALVKIFNEIIYIDTYDQYHFSAAVEEIIISLNKRKKIGRVILSPTEEIDIVRVSDLREYIGIPGQTKESALAFRDKIIMKDVVRQSGFLTPNYAKINSGLDLVRFIDKYNYPVIIKPKTGLGSIKTTVIRSESDLNQFLKNNFNAHYFSNYIAEEYVHGKVYHIDGLFSQEKVIAWPSVYTNSCLEMAIERKVLGSHLLSADNPLTNKLITYASKLLRHFPTPEKTPFHLEVFVTEPDQTIIFCEVASRVGGFLNNSWKSGFGIDLEEFYCHFQAGLDNSFSSLVLPELTKTPGWLLFPTEPNRIIDHLEDQCPLDFCVSYQALKENGDNVGETPGIISNLALMYLLSDSEEDFVHKSEIAISWFQETLKYQPNNIQ